MKAKQKATSTATTRKKLFTDEERGAMQSRARELRGEEADGEGAVQAKLAEMSAADRELGKELHALITSSTPGLAPKLWYGMPAYYKDGKLLCHFQPAQKFKTRYATLGFSDQAKLDEDGLWPVAYALGKLTPDVKSRIRALLEKAAG